MSDTKSGARPDDADRDGRLAGAEDREDVDKGQRFADSRKDGVVDEHSYLDDVGDAVASTIGSVAGVGAETDDKIDDEMHGRDPKRPDSERADAKRGADGKPSS